MARTKGRSRLSVRYFDDRVLLTDTHAWAYYRVPTHSYEFASGADREALAVNITVALAAIRGPDAEVHLRIAHRSYPAADWAARLDATSDGGPGWRDYLDEMYRHVWAKDFWSKEVYLGVRLGQRGMRAQLSGGAFSQFVNAYRAGEQALGLADEAVSDAEIARWTDAAERLGRALGGSALGARHATGGEIAWLFQHTLAGALGDPPPSAARRRTWGAGEIEALLEGQIHNGRTILGLQQPGGVSHAAFLSFSRFPDVMSFPDGEPWLHYADSLPFPVEISSRMRLIPPAKASKDVGRRLAHARDMDAHIREAGVDAPLALAEQIEAARMLEHGITKERLPFVYGWHRLSVSAPTADLCQRRVEALAEHYRDIGIDVVNSTGDQFSLLRESMPGDRVRLSSYVQRQPLYTIAGGVPTATVELGDRAADRLPGPDEWVGPYIGETLGRARSIVHFDPLLAAARNRPTAVAITGEPGGGKTTLALLMALQLAMRGVTVAMIDPKGDAEPLAEVLATRGRKARVLPLGSAAPGLLDPFSFGDDLAEKRTMATETLRLLLPRMSEERESAMVQAVAAIAGRDRPSLGKVVRHLEQAEEPASRNLGAVLRSMSEMRLARLCFSPSGGQRIDAAGWTTVFTLGGLTLPDSSVNRQDLSYEQRLSVALLYLVSQFARRLMNGIDRRLPKAIFLDEAWAITSTPEGAKLVPEVSRMGRSRNTALILVSQNAGDLLNEQVTNCISSVFAFRSSERAEVANVLSLLGVEASEEHKTVLRTLGNGECVFRDLDGRAGRIGVDLISDRMRQWLDTNPTRARLAHPVAPGADPPGPAPGEARATADPPGPAPGEARAGADPPDPAADQRLASPESSPPRLQEPPPMVRPSLRVPRTFAFAAWSLAALAALLGVPSALAAAAGPPSAGAASAAVRQAAPGGGAQSAAARVGSAARAGSAVTLVSADARSASPDQAAPSTMPQTGGLCQVPGIGDIGGLFGFCAAGSSGLIGDINNICQPSVPTPEPANGGIDSLIRPVGRAPAGKRMTLYDSYGVAGQSWAAYDLQCSDMTSLIGNNVAGVVFDAAKALDRVTITVYQSAAGVGILSWLTGAVDHLISSLGNAIYFPYLAPIVILAAIWLAWQGLIRKRATRTIEGTLWMVIACAAAIWLIARPADFTGVGQTVSNGISQTLNVAFAKLPAPRQSACVPVGQADPQVGPVANYSYTSGNSVVDLNANELWTVLVCKPWLDGEFGTTGYAASAGHPTPVNTYGRQLLWAQAIAANEKPTPALVQAKEDAYAGIAASLKQHDPSIYPLFQGKQWTTRLEIAFAALFAAMVAGVLVLIIAITLIILKLGFLLLLVVGPFFLIVGTHPGFGRVVAVRWAEMLVGVLLKQAAIALVLSVLLYAYSLIMGTSDAALPWALKILMISLVTVAVFIYRKPFTHLFSAVGYGMIGSHERAQVSAVRAGQSAVRNTRDAATVAVPGFAAYRVARWARRNPGQAAAAAAQFAGAGAAATAAAGAAAAGAGPAAADGAGPAPAAPPDGTPPDGDRRVPAQRVPGRARGREDVGVGAASGRSAPPLNLPQPGGAQPPAGWSRAGGAGAGNPQTRPAPVRAVPPPRSAPARPAAAPGRPAAPPPRPAPPPAAAARARARAVPPPRDTAEGRTAAPAGEGGVRPFWLRPLRRRHDRPQ